MKKQQPTYGGQGAVAKRYYDPEDRRQRRAGQAQALAGSAGAAGIGYGARGAYKDNKAYRSALKELDSANEYLSSKKRGMVKLGERAAQNSRGRVPGKGTAIISRRHGAGLLAGAAGIGAAAQIGRHMNSNRGRGWN